MFKKIISAYKNQKDESYFYDNQSFIYIFETLLNNNIDIEVTENLAIIYFTKYSIPFNVDTLAELTNLYRDRILNDLKNRYELIFNNLKDYLFDSLVKTQLRVSVSTKNIIDKIINVDKSNKSSNVYNSGSSELFDLFKTLYELNKFEYIEDLEKVKDYNNSDEYDKEILKSLVPISISDIERLFQIANNIQFNNSKIRDNFFEKNFYEKFKANSYLILTILFSQRFFDTWSIRYRSHESFNVNIYNIDNFFKDLIMNNRLNKIYSDILKYKPLTLAEGLTLEPCIEFSKLYKNETNSNLNSIGLKFISVLIHLFWNIENNNSDGIVVGEETTLTPAISLES